jgi:hypothetical protein
MGLQQEDKPGMNPALIFGWLPVIGVVIGLTRARFPRVPLIAAAVLVALYAAYVASTGIYASTCWDCSSSISGSRGDAWQVGAFFLGIMLAITLAGVWLGARLTGSLGRLFAAARELRDATRSDGKHADV